MEVLYVFILDFGLICDGKAKFYQMYQASSVGALAAF